MGLSNKRIYEEHQKGIEKALFNPLLIIKKSVRASGDTCDKTIKKPATSKKGIYSL